MKLGLSLHRNADADLLIAQAQRADRQGFDSIWMGDHLTNNHIAVVNGESHPDIMPEPDRFPDKPLDAFTMMTALGAVTRRVRVAWSMLNYSFRRPLVTAKMLATLDRITKGRVICSLGSGSSMKDNLTYGLPWIDDRDERVVQTREVIEAYKKIWTHPAPAVHDFNGRYISARGLAFNPAPHQRPHPPIWIGGESEATLSLIRELADGWVLNMGGDNARIAATAKATNWPKRPIEVVKTSRIYVANTRDRAIAKSRREFENGGLHMTGDFDEFIATEPIGTLDDCMNHFEMLRDSLGVTYIRVNCLDAEQQDSIAALVLPALAELETSTERAAAQVRSAF